MEGTSKENNSVTELQPMEGTSKENSSVTELTSENFPTLIKSLSGYEVPGFDISREPYDANGWLRPTGFHPFRSSRFGLETMMQENKPKLMHAASISMPPSPIHAHDMHAASISMPPSPTHANVPGTKKVLFRDDDVILGQGLPRIGAAAYVNTGRKGRKPPKFFSQPMPKGSLLHEPSIARKSFQFPPRNPRTDRLRDGRYDSFKTWSGKLERQISTLRGRPRETDQRIRSEKRDDVNNLKVDRYYDALEGPELDKLRASEESILPEDHQWPFLLRFPISSFGICLGVSSQAIMWKTLATSPSISFLHVSIDVNLILWCIAVALVLIVAIIYSLKLIFYFEAVRREYYHPIRVNFFFAPWIALLFLALGVPPSVTQTLPSSLWYILMTPIFFLELKIYGQWMSGGQRRLSKVANPSNHLSVVGNFVGALLGASMGLKEGPIFFFAIGLAHYTVLFVTLYQRLPTNETLPKELHPVFFLFVAAPSVASMAWARIQGSFDYGSRIAYFIAMFLYFSLAVRVNFFRGFRFSLAWWAYTFPMTGAAIATIRYTNVVTNNFTRTLTVVLCLVSTLTVASLLVTTIIHAFVLHDLFPNDIAIAISHRKPKTTRGWFHKRSGSSDNHSIEKFLKYVDSDGKDVETGLHRSASEPGLSGKVEKVFAES